MPGEIQQHIMTELKETNDMCMICANNTALLFMKTLVNALMFFLNGREYESTSDLALGSLIHEPWQILTA